MSFWNPRYVTPLNERERSMEKTVWSKPGLPSDIYERRIAAREGSAKLLAAIERARQC